MGKQESPSTQMTEARVAWSWEAHQHRQIRLGLELTPAERLRWLETTVEGMQKWLGRCRDTSVTS